MTAGLRPGRHRLRGDDAVPVADLLARARRRAELEERHAAWWRRQLAQPIFQPAWPEADPDRPNPTAPPAYPAAPRSAGGRVVVTVAQPSGAAVATTSTGAAS